MSDFDSLLLYLCVFFMTIAFSFLYQKAGHRGRKYGYAVCTILPLVCLQGGRYGVGTDFFSYVRIFERLGRGNALYIKEYTKEPLFLLENNIFYRIFGDYQSVAFFHAVLISVLAFLIFDYFKDSVSMPLMYLVFLLWIYPSFMNMERQAVAMMIVWFSFRYLIEKKYFKYILFVLLASGYHNSALVWLLLCGVYLFENRYLRKYAKYILITVILAASFFYKQIFLFFVDNVGLFKKYAIYFLDTDGKSFAESGGVSVALYAAMFSVPFLFFYKTLVKSKRYNHVYMYMYVLYYALGALVTFFDYAYRIQMYMIFPFIVLIAMGYEALTVRINKVCYGAAYAVMFLHYFIWIYYVNGSAEIFPYRAFWEYQIR